MDVGRGAPEEGAPALRTWARLRAAGALREEEVALSPEGVFVQRLQRVPRELAPRPADTVGEKVAWRLEVRPPPRPGARSPTITATCF